MDVHFVNENLFLLEMCRVVETLKDYAIKALINTVDHLGSVAFKVNNLLDEKIGEVSETELQFTCLEQVPPPSLFCLL